MPIRFHLDEHVPLAIADGLRRRGIDVTTTPDAGLLGAPDEAHFAFGRNEGRVVVTNDPDFLALAQTEQAHAGIAYCDQRRRTIGQVTRRLVTLHESLSAESMVGNVSYL